jgi:hypothetical protein
MFGVAGIRVLDARDDARLLHLVVETTAALTAGASCGVVAPRTGAARIGSGTPRSATGR